MKTTTLVSIVLFSAIFMGQGFAQSLDAPVTMQKNLRDFTSPISREIPKTCDVNDTWVIASIEQQIGKRVRTVKGNYYTCQDHCDCGGYTCTTAKGKKIYVATSCEGNVF